MKKGFTLIELLAVLIVLAIIAVIAVPIVLNVIKETKEKSYDVSVQNVMRAAKIYDLESELTDTPIGMDQNIYEGLKNSLNGTKPDGGYVYIKSSLTGEKREIAFALQYGDWCYTKAYGDPSYEKKKTDVCQVPFDYLIQEKLIDFKVKGEEYFLWKEEDKTNAIKRKQIESVEIKPSDKVSENAIYSWDVSVDKTGKVMAWYEDIDKNELYEVYIGQNGGVKANKDSRFLFAYLTNATEINLTYLDTRQVESMYNMFLGCSSLTTLDVSNFDTSKVENMGSMFRDCSTLTSLDVSNFDTSNVTTMGYMFGSCKKLTDLDLSNFDTSNVTGMASMFNGCSSLTTLDVSNFDTSKVGTTKNNNGMQYMFYNCRLLTTLDLSSFDTSNVSDMSFMFAACNNLTSLDISNFDTSSVTYMTSMFSSCNKLPILDIRSFDTSNVTSMANMFFQTFELKAILVGDKWVINESTDVTEMQVGSKLCLPNSTEERCIVG